MKRRIQNVPSPTGLTFIACSFCPCRFPHKSVAVNASKEISIFTINDRVTHPSLLNNTCLYLTVATTAKVARRSRKPAKSCLGVYKQPSRDFPRVLHFCGSSTCLSSTSATRFDCAESGGRCKLSQLTQFNLLFGGIALRYRHFMCGVDGRSILCRFEPARQSARTAA